MEGKAGRYSIRKILTAIADLSLPRLCPVCGCALNLSERNLCTNCLSELPETYFTRLPHNPMADNLNARIEEMRSPDESYETYSQATALFFYRPDNNYSNISRSLKYRRNFELGKEFASLLGERLAESSCWRNADVLVPVPLHWARRMARGYNQAEVIARAAAAKLPGAKVFPSVLRRTRRTSTQTELNYEDKMKNVSGAFEVNRRFLPRLLAAKPRHIVLIDDVFTTGATLGECHRVLRRAVGSEVRISVATLACFAE